MNSKREIGINIRNNLMLMIILYMALLLLLLPFIINKYNQSLDKE